MLIDIVATGDFIVAARECWGMPHPAARVAASSISVADRDRFFDRGWQSVTIRLSAQTTTRIAEANYAKESFWNGTCRELISKEIGRWFFDNGLAPWPRGAPPRFRISPVEARVFDVTPCGD